MTATGDRLSAVVTGAVQGVGFRWFVLQAARAGALTGYVANRRDGSVEVVAEGPRKKLEGLLERLREGPRAGLVREVRANWSEATGTFEGFDVRF